ncbi:MAG: hypothetical protein AB7P52_06675 [Alphaproteobacteria bacterium]
MTTATFHRVWPYFYTIPQLDGTTAANTERIAWMPWSSAITPQATAN